MYVCIYLVYSISFNEVAMSINLFPSTHNRDSHTELHIYQLTITRHESHYERIEDSSEI